MMSEHNPAVDRLFDMLRSYRSPQVFNFWDENHPDYDQPDGAEQRRSNMRWYLKLFQDAAYVLVSEAPGYAGCRFSGVSFTDERFLFGPEALDWAKACGKFRRSSREDLPLSREKSATVVWKALGARRDIVFWPAFPWHPMGVRGPMSNRAPRRGELQVGNETLRLVLDELFPGRRYLAVGRHAQAALGAMGYGEVGYIRHPSQGGAPEFRRGIEALPLVGNTATTEARRH